MKNENNPFVLLSIILIKKIWHGKIGRMYKQKKRIACRFYPSCSNYAIHSLKKYGFIHGWLKTHQRIKRCTDDNTESTIDYP